MHNLKPSFVRVIRGLLEGKQDKEIAFDLGIKTSTVHFYLSQIYELLGLHSRVQVVIWAYARPEDLDLWPTNPK
jgi:two-component system, NarL family, nitrate/nitrite response regulator NarP